MTKRMDALPCRDYAPLTSRELQMLNQMKAAPGRGTVTISANMLARLLQERDRLFYAAEAARWVCEAGHEEGFLENRPARSDDPDFQRAGVVLRHSLTLIEGIDSGVPQRRKRKKKGG
jgi:hypothetical protein